MADAPKIQPSQSKAADVACSWLPGALEKECRVDVAKKELAAARDLFVLVSSKFSTNNSTPASKGASAAPAEDHHYKSRQLPFFDFSRYAGGESWLERITRQLKLHDNLPRLPRNFHFFPARPQAVDADGDGFNAGQNADQDWDDNNPAVYPGAEEIANNDVDENQDGVMALDVDGDGHVSRETGGDDFNDAEPNAYPGAAEIPYDGIDNDGVEGDLVDVDGDGFSANQVGGRDTNDNNPDINPNAREIPYNGIDEDSNGSDLTDVDGDGSRSSQVAGGTDCDDTRLDIHPAAQEKLGDTDFDCDGVKGNAVPKAISGVGGNAGMYFGSTGVLFDYASEAGRDIYAGGMGNTVDGSWNAGRVLLYQGNINGNLNENNSTTQFVGGNNWGCGNGVLLHDSNGDGLNEITFSCTEPAGKKVFTFNGRQNWAPQYNLEQIWAEVQRDPSAMQRYGVSIIDSSNDIGAWGTEIKELPNHDGIGKRIAFRMYPDLVQVVPESVMTGLATSDVLQNVPGALAISGSFSEVKNLEAKAADNPNHFHGYVITDPTNDADVMSGQGLGGIVRIVRTPLNENILLYSDMQQQQDQSNFVYMMSNIPGNSIGETLTTSQPDANGHSTIAFTGQLNLYLVNDGCLDNIAGGTHILVDDPAVLAQHQIRTFPLTGDGMGVTTKNIQFLKDGIILSVADSGEWKYIPNSFLQNPANQNVPILSPQAAALGVQTHRVNGESRYGSSILVRSGTVMIGSPPPEGVFTGGKVYIYPADNLPSN